MEAPHGCHRLKEHTMAVTPRPLRIMAVTPMPLCCSTHAVTSRHIMAYPCIAATCSLCKHQSQGLAELVGQPNANGGRWQMGLDEFQKFALVVDVDGNSWSSR
eukprot:388985-Pelagomonas_calceolata.AAC.3